MTPYETLPDTTRVWIYQSNRPFSEEEERAIDQQLEAFTRQWVSHNHRLYAFGKLYYRQFVVLMVDESQAGASGCSIDSSVNFIKALEGHYAVDFFDRFNFAYKEGEAVKTARREDFARLYAEGKINDATIVFDNLVDSKGAFQNQWQKPLAESWHKRFV